MVRRLRSDVEAPGDHVVLEALASPGIRNCVATELVLISRDPAPLPDFPELPRRDWISGGAAG
jgi:hypothetical protein